ncbi:MAG: diguanylate cyclase (GGDEF)-like protein [Halieaceae bacterium]|jgi:diguanylate cyclase (GGDEF)-like protein
MTKIIPFKSESTVKHDGPTMTAVASGAELSPDPTLQQAWDVQTEHFFMLLQRLIGCTSTTQAIDRYHLWLSQLGLAGGMQYSSTDGAQQVSVGPRHHHSAHYSLVLDEINLGDITLYRRARYSEAELMRIEQSLGYVARCLQATEEFATLQQLVTQDALTCLGNRTSLHEWMARELSRARRYAGPLSVMMIDVDHFKEINDTLGHLGGDQVLKVIAEVLRSSCRSSDLLFRFGGDEFTILMPHTTPEGAHEAARQIRHNIARVPDEKFGTSLVASSIRPDLSIGIASYHPVDDEQSIMQRADTHLYHAKAQGRGRICSSI